MRRSALAWISIAITICGCLTTRQSSVHPPPAQAEAPKPPGLSRSDSRLRIVTRPDVQTPSLNYARFSPDGKWLTFDVETSDSGRLLAALDLVHFKILTRPLAAYDGGVFSPNGELLAYQSEPKAVSLWKLPEGSERLPFAHSIPSERLLFSRDQSRLAALQTVQEQKTYITIWDLQTRAHPSLLEFPDHNFMEMEFSPDGKYLAVYLDPRKAAAGPPMLQLFQLPGGKNVASVKIASDVVRGLCFAQEGDRLFSLDGEGLREWEIPSLAALGLTAIKGSEEGGHGFRFPESWPALKSGLGNLLCIQTWEGTVVFDSRQRKIVHELKDTIKSSISPSSTMVWALDQKYRQKSIRLKDAAPPAPIEFSRPILSPAGSFNSSHYISIASPTSGEPVVNFQLLALNKNRELEWIGWTSNDDFSGSPHWKDYARVVLREQASERPENLQALQSALLDPTGLVGIATEPAFYNYSPEIAKADNATVKALLDEILREPGSWNQMCSFPGEKPAGVLPLYGNYRRDWASSFISSSNFERLRDCRKAALAEIAGRLPIVLTTVPPKKGKDHNFILGSTDKPEHALEIYLEILLDLNGVESLPALLDLEQSLESSSPYPKSSRPATDSRRYSNHVQILSIITAILANEKVDSIHQLGKETTTYDKNHRDLIVQMARDYLKQTGPEQFQASAGMTLETEYR